MIRRSIILPLFALMLVMGALFFSVPAHAADDVEIENLTVDAVWLTGETLHIEVTDKLTGVQQALEIPLGSYAGNSEYVSVQAVDRNGNLSNTIQFKNPFYSPGAEPEAPTQPEPGESAVPDGSKPFTPDGSGTVVDNVTDGDGKEFFSITTDDGNVFYLIVDRQRNTDNVYLLNAVTEQDLMSLAKPGDGKVSAVPENPAATPTAQEPPPASEPEPAPPVNSGGMSSGTVLFIIIAAAAVGGIGYYFKILRPKKQAADDGADDYEDEGSEYDEEYSEGEDGDGE